MAITINSNDMGINLEWTDGVASTGSDVTITATDLQILLNDLTSIESWLIGALAGKINKCKTRLLDEHRATYFADANVNTDDEVIAAVFAAEGYMTRAERDAASAAEESA
jgi:hypothetical protein|tara:strand:+ start:784 stop:1113 length:330 start_codon:yes stop_codon:yes gene_type:complete